MNGLNQRFTSDTERFLREVPICESEQLMKGGIHKIVPQGVREFDLVPHNSPGWDKFAILNTADSKSKAGESLIKAYWLPWQAGGTTQIELGNAARHFLTSQLGGCQIRIVPIPDGPTKVLHIAGNTGSKDWRKKEAEKALTPGEMKRSRALSSTTAPQSRYGYKGEGVNVVGFKRKHRWEVWGQQVSFDGNSVSRVWRIS
jgi:hypothetical protein